MSDEKCIDISVVIPTWNRANLLDDLLRSLREDIGGYKYGNVEIIIVDSSSDEQQLSIQNSCKVYCADYYESVQSVRKKRNLGIKQARYPIILFIDSDVVVEKDILNYHAEQYLHPVVGNLGGVLGYTEFVGDMSFWWNILENTMLIDSFSFAKMYPFNSWTIGNNVSFYKHVLVEIGMFEENFPFKLGGDDLDLSYRVTKAGYMIKSCPEAVTYHSRETWNCYKAIHDRAKRWGTMDSFITTRHPELLKRAVPTQPVISVIVTIFLLAAMLISWSLTPIFVLTLWVLLVIFTNYIVRTKGKKNILYYFLGQLVMKQYRFYRALGYIKRGNLNWFTKETCFNNYQTRFGMTDYARTMWINIIGLWVSTLVVIVANAFI